jgi:hypothetical protein
LRAKELELDSSAMSLKDSEVADLIHRRIAERLLPRDHLNDLKPVKVQLAPTAERDNLLRVVQQLRLDIAKVPALLQVRHRQLYGAEAEAKAESDQVFSMTLQAQEESQRILGLVAAAPATPLRSSWQKVALASPAQWAGGFVASLPPEAARGFHPWVASQPSIVPAGAGASTPSGTRRATS